MLRFEYSSIIKAPVEKVWQFHQREDVLDLLTPPWQPVKIIRREGGLEIGATTEFIIQLAFIPVPWIARHVECRPYEVFIDRQIKGPMVSWEHQHIFKQKESQQTQLIDRIDYEIPGGWLSEFILGWWVNSRLKEMFKYRHHITQSSVNSHQL